MDLFTEPYAPDLTQIDWTPTREAGLRRLSDFAVHAGRPYARDRNIDRGPADRANVSGLSPWIRRRMIAEEEVIAAVLKRHSFAAAQKFVEEVFWRSYWKGWLEMRPGVLLRVDAERKALSAEWRGDPRLKSAMDGRTGIDCYDAWVRELIDIGWLHNHARMWFASIWIFTLRLPWQLGADFFYKRLIDADPASNTLSWRWVAGLHTVGKHYLARAANIRDNTLGRFDPQGRLDERATPLAEAAPPTPRAPLPVGGRIAAGRVAILLTEEDLHSESWDIEADVAACAAVASPKVAADDAPAARFGAGALDDGLARAAQFFATGAEHIPPDRALDWAKGVGVTEIVTGFAPTGLVAWRLDRIEQALAREGIRLVRLQRPFDARVWPLATAGFFKLKEKIPHLVETAGLEIGR